MTEITDEHRAAVIAELRAKAADLAPAGRNAFPGMCGTVSGVKDGVVWGPEPAGLYGEEGTLKRTVAVFTRMLDAAEGVTLYQPSNGFEGEIFMGRWCEACTKDNLDPNTGEGGCPIIAYTMALDIDDPDYPREWRLDAEGAPTCTAFEDEEAKVAREKRRRRWDSLSRQDLLFPLIPEQIAELDALDKEFGVSEVEL